MGAKRDGSPPPRQTSINPGQSKGTTEIAGEVVRKITAAYEIAKRAPKIPLPKHASGAHEKMEEKEEAPNPHAYRAGVHEMGTLNKSPRVQSRRRSMRAILKQSLSPSPADPANTRATKPAIMNPPHDRPGTIWKQAQCEMKPMMTKISTISKALG